MYKRDHYAIRRDGVDIIGVQLLVDLPHTESLLAELVRTIAGLYAWVPTVGGRIDWAFLGWASSTEHDELWNDVLDRIPSDRGQRSQIRDAVTAARATGDLPESPPYSVTQLDRLDRLVTAVTDPERQTS